MIKKKDEAMTLTVLKKKADAEKEFVVS